MVRGDSGSDEAGETGGSDEAGEIGGSGETVGSDEARGQERQGTHERLARQGSRFLGLIRKGF